VVLMQQDWKTCNKVYFTVHILHPEAYNYCTADVRVLMADTNT
jgi:hypothetical protein